MWHGDGNLEKAINLLDQNEKDDFRYFTETKHVLIHTICLYVDQILKNIMSQFFHGLKDVKIYLVLKI